MTDTPFKTALIVGTGSGLSASLARRFSKAGLRVGIAARNKEKLEALAAETGGFAFACDASIPSEVARLFEEAEQTIGAPDVVVYNASARVRGLVADIDPEAVAQALQVTAYGGFLVGQQAARQMLARGKRRHFLHGCHGERKRVCAIRVLRNGKICLARAGAEHGP